MSARITRPLQIKQYNVYLQAATKRRYEELLYTYYMAGIPSALAAMTKTEGLKTYHELHQIIYPTKEKKDIEEELSAEDIIKKTFIVKRAGD